MVEIYENIPQYFRDEAERWFDLAMRQGDAIVATNLLAKFRELCVDDEQRAFTDFYFNLRFEQLRQESGEEEEDND